MWNQLRVKTIAAALLLLMTAGAAIPATAAARKKKSGSAKKNSPAVPHAQMELAQQMARNSYAMGRSLELHRRVALLTRLLYTMRPEVMPLEKKQWAEELFVLAQQMPGDTAEAASARDAVIATAASRLATYDSDRALELLDSLPAEAPVANVRADARTMAARLVFAGYVQHHGAAGGSTLLVHARRWSEQGSFPYSASATVLARLRPNEDAAEDFFRQELAIFAKGREGLFGVSDFASLLQQAATMEAIYEDTAEEAGRAVVGQLRKFAESESAPLTEEQKRLVVEALNNVRISAPKAYEDARKAAPALIATHAERVKVQVDVPKVDADLQTAFHELAEAMRERRGPEEMNAVITRGLQVVNSKYKAGSCADCKSPDVQSWALVSLAAYAAPNRIATQLNGIEDPFWRAYFLAIAAQQVGQPTRVADPTARKLPGKEVAEPE
jgi:hypothetical protein